MKKPPAEVSEYLAAIGRKGGQAKGARKRRSRAHYQAIGRKGGAARKGEK